MRRRFLTLAMAMAVVSCSERTTDNASETTTAVPRVERPAAGFSLLPDKNEVPLTPESICEGLANATEQSTQNFADETAMLCDGGSPTDLLANLVASPYAGAGAPNLTYLANGGAGGGNERITVAYSMRIDKKAVPLILGEEPYVKTTRYSHDGFSIRFEFVDPPLNEGDSDTAFAVKQFTSRHGDRVNFDDVSLHDLRLYRMFPDNFDFLVAIRTLQAPSGQFSNSDVIRAVMTDPNDDEKAISVSVINLTMNGRGEGEKLREAVRRYLSVDASSIYQFHNN